MDIPEKEGITLPEQLVEENLPVAACDNSLKQSEHSATTAAESPMMGTEEACEITAEEDTGETPDTEVLETAETAKDTEDVEDAEVYIDLYDFDDTEEIEDVEESGAVPEIFVEEADPADSKINLRKTAKIVSIVLGAVAAAVLLVFLSSSFTAFLINQYWQHQTDLLNEATQNRLNVLMERIETLEKVGGPSGSASSGQENVLSPSQVYYNNVHAVVAINAQISATNAFGQVTEGSAAGSGFIISADGYVVTNYHVVEGAYALTVITYDGTEHEARLVGYDSTNDIAVLKVEAKSLPYVTIGSSDSLIVGDQVAAIGNPLGTLSSTLTVGYISAKDRMVTTTGVAINMLQTDAAINSGNSGGPLFNMAGQVVGITTAKYSGYSNSGAAIEGIGFAIPINDVIDMIRDLQEYGYITGAYLGVTVRDVSQALATEYGLPLGTRVEEVVPGVSADRAGILPGDIIIDLGGYEIENISDLSRALRQFDAGDETTITVYRSGAKINLKIVLDEKPREMSTG